MNNHSPSYLSSTTTKGMFGLVLGLIYHMRLSIHKLFNGPCVIFGHVTIIINTLVDHDHILGIH